MTDHDMRIGSLVEIATDFDGTLSGIIVRVGKSISHVRMTDSGRIRWFHNASIKPVKVTGQHRVRVTAT